MRRISAILGVGAALAAPCGASWAAAPPRITVGLDPIDANSNFFVAQAQGMFADAGVVVDAQATANGAAGAAALVSGSLDITNMNVASLAGALQRNIPLVVVALSEMYTSKTPTTQLLVPNDSPLVGPRDLPGKTVAVNVIGGLADIATRLWLQKNAVDPKSVQIVEMPFAVMPDALTTGRVNAIFVAEPGLSTAKSRGARVLASAFDAIAPEFLIGACVANRAWAAQNTDALQRFAAAMHRGSIWANQHHDQTAVIAGQAFHEDVAKIRAQTRATFAENESPAKLLQPVFDAVAKYKNWPVEIKATDVISPTLTG
ncbi:MAG: ABC transporter substrate-binding protein [Candidatus Lustribacter sp.]